MHINNLSVKEYQMIHSWAEHDFEKIALQIPRTQSHYITLLQKNKVFKNSKTRFFLVLNHQYSVVMDGKLLLEKQLGVPLI